MSCNSLNRLSPAFRSVKVLRQRLIVCGLTSNRCKFYSKRKKYPPQLKWQAKIKFRRLEVRSNFSYRLLIR